MPPPFVLLDGCTPLHIHASVDKYNLAYFISNRRRDSGSYVTYLDNSVTQFDWNQYASGLALARMLALGFVLIHTHTLAWSFWKRFAYSFWRTGPWLRLFVFRRRAGRRNQNVVIVEFVEYTVWARCSSARRDFIANHFPPAFCARRSGVTAVCCVIHAGLSEPECRVQHIPPTDEKMELISCAPP